jgi:hypothetical protein
VGGDLLREGIMGRAAITEVFRLSRAAAMRSAAPARRSRLLDMELYCE